MVRSKPWPVFCMEQVAEHNHKDDCWIVVDDKVYDMTPHVRNHEGWIGSGKISTLLAILSCMGTDCTEDFNATHDSRGFKELHAFQVPGDARFPLFPEMRALSIPRS
jgi:cytochrome b involved in lipid metabolism